jgi:outer membrane receptor for ferrienterochelin and colicins
VLRKEDIALRAATDFSRAAEQINGLRVESNCQNCNTSEVQLLGLPGAYNQLLFDGIPLLSTLGSVYGLEQIRPGSSTASKWSRAAARRCTARARLPV